MGTANIAKLTGRELDAAIAEKVMGWKVYPGLTPGDDAVYPHIEWIEGNVYQPRGYMLWESLEVDGVYWSASADIANAWEVLLKVTGGSGVYSLSSMRDGNRGNFCTIGVLPHDFSSFHKHFLGTGDTMPEAICRAAIAAVTR